MKIVEPYARLMSFDADGNQIEFTQRMGIGLLRRIEWFARLSHRSEDAMTPDSYDRFLRFVVMQKGDWSVVEHASASVDCVVDRGITHEGVRHRLQSPTQESTRFVNYRKKAGLMGFVAPEFANPQQERAWMDAMEEGEQSYEALLDVGFPPEIARDALPHGLAARIGLTNNLRNWRYILLMRTTSEAHRKMRQAMIPLLAEFKEKIPILFEDIEPGAKQSENLRKGR